MPVGSGVGAHTGFGDKDFGNIPAVVESIGKCQPRLDIDAGSVCRSHGTCTEICRMYGDAEAGVRMSEKKLSSGDGRR